MKSSLLFLLLLLTSCSNPFQGESTLNFKTRPFTDPLIETERLRLLRIEKDKAWQKIIVDANESFKEIAGTIERKCFACHDANTKTPIYGRVLTGVNPVYQHRKDGIQSLDFSKKFPLTAKGSPSQIALLKAIKNQVLDRTMPLKAYTTFFRGRKINQQDEQRILAWIDPLIETIEEFELRFQDTEVTLESQVKHIFEQKCFRCHANGSQRGHFGNMQDAQALLHSPQVDLNHPTDSKIYKLSAEKKMPPNKRDALTEEELHIMNEWLESHSN